MGSVEHDLVVGGRNSGDTVLTCYDVAEITMMSHSLARTSVGNTFGVPMWACGHAAFAEVACQKVNQLFFRNERSATYQTGGRGSHATQVQVQSFQL